MEIAIASAGRIIKETTAQGVKLEGAIPSTIEAIQRLTDIGIPVMGHIGLTPQSVHQLGYRQQGKSDRAAEQLIQQALALESAGVFSLVLEHIPTNLARDITSKLSIPTIGIGAGAYCDGQVLVTADLLGLSERNPPFAKAYANLRQTITDATTQFIEDVKN
ncbi:MAG: 3-methyl-2-oxobutanoate hydroxymethyltransferase, partial [Synechococcaceae cyanobacterium RL_1_2]|nr:3-methyl-2-oxobutanoate hydroxymethyltransferase [Synechococcaceae cyanobacterium RL_1_2]